jgi:SAM-dependent methyltransferase
MSDMMADRTDDRRDSFDRNAAGYAEGRPPYPDRVYAFMEEIGALREGLRVLEIGPGTGQATGELLRRGARVDAIELGAHMAATLRGRLPDDGLHIVVGNAHTVPLPDATYDAVVAATTLHWLDPNRLLPRLARALKPGGWLVVWWNVFGDPEVITPFRERVDAAFRTHLPSEWRDPGEVPRALLVEERLQELTQGGMFGGARHEIIRWTHRMDAAGVRKLFSTFPALANLNDTSRATMLDALSTAVEAEGGLIDDPFVTVIYAARSLTKASSL